jgi:hypothetical protein
MTFPVNLCRYCAAMDPTARCSAIFIQHALLAGGVLRSEEHQAAGRVPPRIGRQVKTKLPV